MQRWQARTAVAVLRVAVVIGLAITWATATNPAGAAPQTVDMFVTLYGWADNSPPGCATAYAGCAAGTGTYSDPITFATDQAEFPVGTIVYYAPLARYFVMHDDCAECDQDWTGHGPDGGPGFRHIDLWAGGCASCRGTAALMSCEDYWTSNGQVPVIVMPPGSEPVANGGAGGPVFVAGTSHCWRPSDNGGIGAHPAGQRTVRPGAVPAR